MQANISSTTAQVNARQTKNECKQRGHLQATASTRNQRTCQCKHHQPSDADSRTPPPNAQAQGRARQLRRHPPQRHPRLHSQWGDHSVGPLALPSTAGRPLHITRHWASGCTAKPTRWNNSPPMDVDMAPMCGYNNSNAPTHQSPHQQLRHGRTPRNDDP